jgi:hypothetical protein
MENLLLARLLVAQLEVLVESDPLQQELAVAAMVLKALTEALVTEQQLVVESQL